MTNLKDFLQELLEREEGKDFKKTFILILVITIVSFAIWLALYVLRAISVYTMAKSVGTAAPWLAFIPVLNLFTFGAIAEKREKRDGKKPAKYSLLLLFFELIKEILAALFLFLFLLRVEEIIGRLTEGITGSDIVRMALPLFFIFIVIIGIGIAEIILRYVALYRIFLIFSYQNAGLFTTLSILGMFFLSDILEPILLFVVRKNTPVLSYRDQLNGFSVNQEFYEQ